MKQTKLDLNGKEVPIRFDLGAIEDFCEEMEVDFTEFTSKALNSPKAIRTLIFHMAKAAGSDVKKDELRRLDFDQLSKVTEFISGDGEGKGKK